MYVCVRKKYSWGLSSVDIYVWGYGGKGRNCNTLTIKEKEEKLYLIKKSLETEYFVLWF